MFLSFNDVIDGITGTAVCMYTSSEDSYRNRKADEDSDVVYLSIGWCFTTGTVRNERVCMYTFMNEDSMI